MNLLYYKNNVNSINYKLILVIDVFEIYNPHLSTLTLLGPALSN